MTTQDNNVAIVNTYTVQPNGTAPTTPGAEGASPGEEDDDGDGLDQLAVKFTRSYHVNKSPKKSPRKGSVQAQHGLTPPASTTFSPPMVQAQQFLSPGETQVNPLDYDQQDTFEGLGINGMAPQGYTMAPQYIPSPNLIPGQFQQYVRSPMQMMQNMHAQPLQQLHNNPRVQRSPARMAPVLQPTSPMVMAHSLQMQGSPQRLRQHTQPLPGQMVYDENVLMHAALISQMQQQQQQQLQQQLQQSYLSPSAHIPKSPQRPQKPISRSLPSSPEKRRYANQLAQVSELDVLSIPTPLVSSPTRPPQQQSDFQHAEPKSSHLRGISFLDELFEVPAEPKGPLAPDGTLRTEEEDEQDGYDDAALEADVNSWLEGRDQLAEGTGWLDQVVLN